VNAAFLESTGSVQHRSAALSALPVRENFSRLGFSLAEDV